MISPKSITKLFSITKIRIKNDSLAQSIQIYNQNTNLYLDLHSGLIIGRKQGDEIFPDDKALSKKHCEFKIEGPNLFVRDLGSANGTFVNDKKLVSNEWVEMNENDKLRLGNQNFIYGDSKPESAKADATQTSQFSDSSIVKYVLCDLKTKQEFDIQDHFSLGRRAGNDICISGEKKISGLHLRFHIRSDSLFIEDLNSSNGTKLNDAEIKGQGLASLKLNDKIMLGQREFVVMEKQELKQSEALFTSLRQFDFKSIFDIRPDSKTIAQVKEDKLLIIFCASILLLSLERLPAIGFILLALLIVPIFFIFCLKIAKTDMHRASFGLVLALLWYGGGYAGSKILMCQLFGSVPSCAAVTAKLNGKKAGQEIVRAACKRKFRPLCIKYGVEDPKLLKELKGE